jgi:DNA-binding MarR family transcriptional regulator
VVKEVSDNADGRSRPIALTPAGKELLLNAQPAWLGATAQAKARLGKEGTMALISIADRITYPAEESSEDPRPQPVNLAD